MAKRGQKWPLGGGFVVTGLTSYGGNTQWSIVSWPDSDEPILGIKIGSRYGYLG